MTTSSSATSPCSSPTPPEPGWSICLLRRFPTGTIWSKPLLETSRAHTCALGTPGISEAAASSQGIPAGLHPVVFEAAHRAAQHHRLECHQHVPRWHHLSRPGEQTGSQDSYQGERVDGHRHQFASGQEAVEAIFRKDKQPQGRQSKDVPEASAQRGTKKKGKKKSQAKRNATNTDLVAVAEHGNLRKPPRGANLFDKMLKESCPYHQGPVKHTLEECVMLRRYFHKAGPPTEGGRGHNNDKKEGNKAEEFPEVHDCFMIYGGRVANASARHRKQERREVCSVKVAAPVYLDWSDKPITFDKGDHPDRVPSPGKYPLVVDPVIGNVRLTKVLMDGGNNLNIIAQDARKKQPDQSRRLAGPAGRSSGRGLATLGVISAVSATLPRPRGSAPRPPSGRLGASAAARRPRAPQAYSSLGGAIHHRQDFEAWNIQAGQQSRRGLQQRLEHPTATSLLPLRCFQLVHIPYFLYIHK
jgi:hypothetical protein